LFSNTAGNDNNAFGYYALRANTTYIVMQMEIETLLPVQTLCLVIQRVMITTLSVIMH